MNIENVVAVESFLLPGAARDTACQPNTTQLTTEAFWTGRRGVSEVRYNLFNSEFGFCDIWIQSPVSVKSVLIALCYK